ncbi:MAG: phytanoyl-CoA dioxygenase family protein [Candidatus Sericytochromatia bacterium]
MEQKELINFLKGLYSIVLLDENFTNEIDKLKKYYLEKSTYNKKEELINSFFIDKFDIELAKNSFDIEIKELFFNLLILLSEIQLNTIKKEELILEYAEKLFFDKEKIVEIKENLKKELAKNLDFTPFNWLTRLINGYINFKNLGVTSIETYYSFRLLHFLTNGRINKLLNLITQVFNPYEEKESNSIFKLEYNEALKALKKDGIYIFRNKLPEKLINIALNYSNKNNCYPVPSDKKYEDCFIGEGIYFQNEKEYQTARYDYKVSDLVNKKDFFDILSETNLTDFARKYFNSKCLLDVIRLWWSTPVRDKFDRYTGQVFHIDIDRASSLLFIIYLTDVKEGNSPHVYVKGSHNSKPFNLLEDRRMLPEDIENNYEKNAILKAIGDKGTIIAIDPLGFHRGEPLEFGNRLALKYQFSNDGFGEPLGFYKISDLEAKNKVKILQEEYDFTFSRFIF